MNSNLDATLQALPFVIYLIISIIILALAISWLVLPWTISGHLKRMVKIQQFQLEELERIARNTKPPGSPNVRSSGASYRMP